MHLIERTQEEEEEDEEKQLSFHGLWHIFSWIQPDVDVSQTDMARNIIINQPEQRGPFSRVTYFTEYNFWPRDEDEAEQKGRHGVRAQQQQWQQLKSA